MHCQGKLVDYCQHPTYQKSDILFLPIFSWSIPLLCFLLFTVEMQHMLAAINDLQHTYL